VKLSTIAYRFRPTALVTVVVALALAGCTASSSPSSSTAVIQPLQAAVGVKHETFVDPSRATPASGSVPGHPGRVLQTTIYYPAKGTARAAAVVDAQPDTRAAPYPLIVFAHGFGSSLNEYQALLVRWAVAGYVVAVPLFPLTRSDAPGGPDLADFANQPADLGFLITQVVQESSRSGGLLTGLVDPRHIGAAGHSLGGVTTLGLVANTCCRDARVAAAIVISGDPISFPTGTVDLASAPPLLLVHGNADPVVPYVSSIDAFNSAHPPKGLLTVVGGGHDSPVVPTGRAFPSVVRTTIGFFNHYLKGENNGDADLATDVTKGATTLTFVSDPEQDVHLSAPPTPSRHRRATVTPTQHLANGTTLHVTWSGFSPGVAINILQCSTSPPTQASDCDLHTAKLGQPDPRGSGSLRFTVHTGAVGSGICSAGLSKDCVVVVNEGGSLAATSSVISPVSFGP